MDALGFEVKPGSLLMKLSRADSNLLSKKMRIMFLQEFGGEAYFADVEVYDEEIRIQSFLQKNKSSTNQPYNVNQVYKTRLTNCVCVSIELFEGEDIQKFIRMRNGINIPAPFSQLYLKNE